MKKATTIMREIYRLEEMAEDATLPVHTQSEAYEAYHALRWAIDDVSLRPSTLIKEAAEAGSET